MRKLPIYVLGLVLFSLCFSTVTLAKGKVKVFNDTNEAIQVCYYNGVDRSCCAPWGHKVRVIKSGEETAFRTKSGLFSHYNKRIGIPGYDVKKVHSGETVNVSGLNTLKNNAIVPHGWMLVQNDTDSYQEFTLTSYTGTGRVVYEKFALQPGEEWAYCTVIYSNRYEWMYRNAIQVQGRVPKAFRSEEIVTISELLACKKSDCHEEGTQTTSRNLGDSTDSMEESFGYGLMSFIH